MSKISDVMQGVFTQNEFAKLVMMGSGGLLELYAPLTDEERRDFEIHMRGHFGSSLALQIKSALELARLSVNAQYLRIYFDVRASRLLSDPLFWYFFAYLNPKTMRFQDPTFLIPSAVVHEHASPVKKGDVWQFNFEASMEPDSQDKWHPFRISQFELGKKILSVTKDLSKLQAASQEASRLIEMPGLVWARRV